jgi:histidinol-phosphate phosphatase family protein
MIAVIQAGGKGTRLRDVTNDEIPKPMVPVLKKPLLLWQLEKCKENGIHDFIFIIGHLGDKIKSYFGDGSKYDVTIRYIEEKEPLGTAGAFYYLSKMVGNQDFILAYGDVFFDIDINRMIQYHKEKNAAATLFVHPNSHPYDSDLVLLNNEEQIIQFVSKNQERKEWYDNCVNAGFYIINGSVCRKVTRPEKCDLEKDLFRLMLKERDFIYGYRSPEYVKDFGTLERLAQVEQDVACGFTSKRNLKNPQKCVFLDRDGTVNKYRGLLYKEEDFELEEKVSEALKLLNHSEYLAIIVTNQPSVARGLCEMEDVDRIHKKMATLLGEQGVYLDEIIYCPHHPDKGYPEENTAYKINCTCRKPKIGMLEKCAEQFNIDLPASWMVGDTTVDIQTGRNAGTHTALVLTGEAGQDGKYKIEPDVVGENLLTVVKAILY